MGPPCPLLSSSLDPVIVQPAAPGVKMASLLFATQTDCVLVGDSDGQVTVYQLKNPSVGDGSQVEPTVHIWWEVGQTTVLSVFVFGRCIGQLKVFFFIFSCRLIFWKASSALQLPDSFQKHADIYPNHLGFWVQKIYQYQEIKYMYGCVSNINVFCYQQHQVNHRGD